MALYNYKIIWKAGKLKTNLHYKIPMPTTISHTRRYIVQNEEQPQHTNLFDRLIMFFTPKKRADSIKKGLAQAKEIQEGKVQAKSFEEAIAEL